jgi:putative transposase
LVIVKPETVIGWHRKGFRLFWTWKVRHGQPGRPPVSKEIRQLIRKMSLENPLWGAPRIHGELLKLGIDIGETSVGKYIVCRRNPPSQNWRTFLENHVKTMVSVDFFTVPTIRFQVLYVFLVLAHDRRRIVHFNVTAHPTAEWTAQQLREAFPFEQIPRYLLRDRDRIFGGEFRKDVKAMGIKEVLSAPRSPWQRAYVERVIGTIRRECLDHVIVLNEASPNKEGEIFECGPLEDGCHLYGGWFYFVGEMVTADERNHNAPDLVRVPTSFTMDRGYRSARKTCRRCGAG